MAIGDILQKGINGLKDFLSPDEEASVLKPIKLNEDKQQEVVNLVVKNYENTTSSKWWQNLLNDWKEWHKIALSKMDPTTFPWQDASNVDLGIVEMTCDNIKARYKTSTVGAKPMFNAIPISAEGEAAKEQVTDSMNYILDADIDADKRVDTISSNTIEYGTCVVKNFWKTDLIQIKEYKEMGGVRFPMDKDLTEEKGCWDIIELPDAIVPEGSSSDICKLPWFYQRVWYSLNDLEKKVRLGQYSEEAVEKIKAGLTEQKTSGLKTPEEKLKAIEKMPEERVEILECYMRFRIDEDFEQECIFWVCPTTRTYINGYYLRDIYHKGTRPLKVFRYKDTGSFHGRGVPEVLKPYRESLNTVFNHGVNCMMLQILPWGFYRIGSSFRPEEVRLAPGVFIPVDDINDVSVTTFPPTAQAVSGLIELLVQFIEKQTGISAPQMGNPFPTRKTATEVKTVMSEGNIKHEDRIVTFQDVFSELLKDTFNLYRQNAPEGREGRIIEGDQARYVKLFSAFDNIPDYDFIIMGTMTTGNKAIEREDSMGLYTISQQSPIFQNYPVGQLEMLKELFTTFGKRNLQRFLPPDDLVKAMTEMHIQAILGKAAMAAQGGQLAQPGQAPQPQGGPGGE
jgi:hypothetical protein